MPTNHFCYHLPAALDANLLRGCQPCSGDVLGSLQHPLGKSPFEGGAAPGVDVLTPNPNPSPNSVGTPFMLKGYLESEMNLHPCKV